MTNKQRQLSQLIGVKMREKFKRIYNYKSDFMGGR